MEGKSRRPTPGRHAVVTLLLAVLAASACAPATPSPSGYVEVLGSWTGDELAAFLDVVKPFEDRTGVHVVYASTRDLPGVLAARVAAADPPDLAGLQGPAHLAQLAAAGQLQDLGNVLAEAGYWSRVAPTFIDLGSVDGRLVGVFLRSSVKGLIWYNPAVFQLGAPRTWDELQRMAVQAAESAHREWCVGLESEESSGWPGTDLIEQFVLREAGVDVYDRWAAGEVSWTSPEIRRAFELFGQVVAEGTVHGGAKGALETDFREAGVPLFSDPPGCLFLHQGSFMPVFFREGSRSATGESPAPSDFDFFPFPDLAPTSKTAVIGAGDLFGLLTDRPAASELMRYLVSDEAQSIWVASGGSLSVNAGVVDYPDRVSQRAAELLSGADLFRFDASDRMPPAIAGGFNAAVLAFTADHTELDSILAEVDAVRVAEYAQ